MSHQIRILAASLCCLFIVGEARAQAVDSTRPALRTFPTRLITFTSHDGHDMRGQLTLPEVGGPHPVIVYAQTAEGMTMEVRRQLGNGRTFRYMDLYASRLPEMGVGFFRYEGRGIRAGDAPPRFEVIDTAVFNTSSIENKVRDLVSAVETLRQQPGIDASQIVLIGASEGTLIVAEAAARLKTRVVGAVMYGVMAANMRETFRYIMSDGAYLPYRISFDGDGDGVVTPAEYDRVVTSPRGARLANTPFSSFDITKDGLFSVDDITVATARYLTAIDSSDYAVLSAWAKSFAGVTTPANWFRDHFEHSSLWSAMETLEIPVGLFHGVQDAMTPVSKVRELEAKAAASSKKQFEFHYFEKGDHSLGLNSFFSGGSLPDGHVAIFDYIDRLLRKRRH